MAKSWWRSKSIWIAAMQIVAGVLGAILGQEWITNNPQAVAVIVTIVGVLNAVIRSITTKPIKLGA